MKKLVILLLTVLLAIALVACSSTGAPPAGGGDEQEDQDDIYVTGGDDETSFADVDFSSIFSGNGTTKLLSDYSATDRQKLVSEAKDNGVDISFGADGSATLKYDDGSVAKQNSDGTWNVTSADGEEGQLGGEWPDNEYTKQLPKPSFGIFAAMVDDAEGTFGVTFADGDLDGIKAYVETVKASGFTINAETSGDSVAGLNMYSFMAENEAGYTVEILHTQGMSALHITKP